MKKKHVWIAESLYQEILRAKECLEEQPIRNKKSKITILEVSDRIGKHLNTLRNNNLYKNGNKK